MKKWEQFVSVSCWKIFFYFLRQFFWRVLGIVKWICQGQWYCVSHIFLEKFWKFINKIWSALLSCYLKLLSERNWKIFCKIISIWSLPKADLVNSSFKVLTSWFLSQNKFESQQNFAFWSPSSKGKPWNSNKLIQKII